MTGCTSLNFVHDFQYLRAEATGNEYDAITVKTSKFRLVPSMFLKVKETQSLFENNDITSSIMCNLEGELICSSGVEMPAKFASLVSHIWSLYLQFPTIDTTQLEASSIKIPTCSPNRNFHQRSNIQEIIIENDEGKIVIIGVRPGFLLASKRVDGYLLNRLKKLAKSLNIESDKE
eukprot:NODE_159_length_15043_cov_0.440444.p9 type:complete len:176 gc:universal NODE_159_length_15043_cov_0.440444:3051-2524(-)